MAAAVEEKNVEELFALEMAELRLRTRVNERSHTGRLTRSFLKTPLTPARSVIL